MPPKPKQKPFINPIDIYIEQNDDGTYPDDPDPIVVFDFDSFADSRNKAFLESGNPLYVWDVIRAGAEHRKNLPAWVVDYLHQTATKLTTYEVPEKNKVWQKDLAERLGFQPKHHQKSPLRKWAIACSKSRAIFHVTLWVNYHGMEVLDACEKVAKDMGVEYLRVQEWYYENNTTT